MERYTEMCGDNRFELIKKYKERLIEKTNIETDKAEMNVIDSILFRFWQMGWLDRLEADEVPKDGMTPLEYKLVGVMHSVDKWLEGDELNQDEVNRAITMREKTLKIVEALEDERDKYKKLYKQLSEDFERALYYAGKNNNVCNFCTKDCGEVVDGVRQACKGRENWIECQPKWRGIVETKADGERLQSF